MPRAAWKAVLREPLLYFAVVGALLFLGQRALERSAGGGAARVPPVELKAARAQLAQELRRAPSPDEESALLARMLDEEILVREALALGLDRNDPILRRRLAQKMLFFAEDLGAGSDPTEAEAQAFATAHPELYQHPARLTFEQLFFDRATRPHPRQAAAAALSKLDQGEEVAGDPFAWGRHFVGQEPSELEERFGAAFAEAARQATVGHWVGPLESPYGQHLLRVEGHTAAQAPPLPEILGRVRGDLIESRRRAAREALLQRLRVKYGVPAAGPGGPLLPPSLASEEGR